MKSQATTTRPSHLEAREVHVQALKGLAQLSRLRIFFFLVRRGEETAVGDIQEALDIPWPTLSYHLEKLRSAGLVESRREERYVLHSVKEEMVSDLVRLLTACC